MKGIVLMMVMLILLAPADKVQAGNPFPPSFPKIKFDMECYAKWCRKCYIFLNRKAFPKFKSFENCVDAVKIHCAVANYADIPNLWS